MFSDILSPIATFFVFIAIDYPILQWVITLVVLIALFIIFRQAWLFSRMSLYKNAIEWTLLEIKIPREVQQTPKAMEQFFMNLHGLRNAPVNFLEKYIDGEVTLWWSLELVSFGGEVHFYIRTPSKHKKMTAAGIYAQYPNAEMIEVPDYLDTLPKTTIDIYKQGKNFFGSEFVLTKDDFYPITTYKEFELTKEELALDPISALLEVLANIHKQETVCIQILIQPASAAWKKVGQDFVLKYIGREESKTTKGGAGIAEFLSNLFLAPSEYPTWKEADKKETKDWTKSKIMGLTPGEKKVITAIEEKLSKPGFNSLVRFIYLAPLPIFSVNFARRGLLGGFNQYATQDMNAFRGNWSVETRTMWIYYPYFFVKRRTEGRKQRLLHNFCNRLLPEELTFGNIFKMHPLNFNFDSKSYILDAAELATLYHIPSEKVLTAPHIKRAESKKMGPPAGLPIFSE